MVAFDVRTGYFATAVLCVVLSASTWVVLAAQRNRATRLWCTGALLTGAAFLLLALNDHIQPMLASALGSTLLLLGVLLHYQAFRVHVGSALSTRWMFVVPVAFMLSHELIQLLASNSVTRLQLAYALHGFSVMVLLKVLAGTAQFAKVRRPANALWLIRAGYAVVAILMMNQFCVLTGMAQTTALSANWVSQLICVSLIATVVSSHIAFVGAVVEHSARARLLTYVQERDDESRRLGAQIMHMDRQRNLGAMAVSFGHELSQPLTAILTQAQVAKRAMKLNRFDHAQVDDLLDNVAHNTHRAKQIIERIRDFVRPNENKQECINLVSIVQEVMALVSHDATSRKVTISLVPLQSPMNVMGNAIQISQVVLNVIRNAMEAMSECARREIRITLFTQSTRAVVRIQDTGTGIAPEFLEQIGRPFFTTKSNGLGMGLSISRSIVEMFNGILRIANAEGEGVRVELDFPALNEKEGSVSTSDVDCSDHA